MWLFLWSQKTPICLWNFYTVCFVLPLLLYFCLPHSSPVCEVLQYNVWGMELISEASCLHPAEHLRTVFGALLYLSIDILQMFNLKLMCSPTEVNGITKVLKVIPCWIRLLRVRINVPNFLFMHQISID